jgi:hypothetical protein
MATPVIPDDAPRHDPLAALDRAAMLPPQDRAAFAAAVAQEWAFVDPSGFFAFAESAVSIDHLVDGLELLIATDPEHVLRIAAGHRGAGNTSIDALHLAAVRGMTSRDPPGAIARLEPAAAGRMREPILTSIAEAYAALDMEAALAWAVSLDPPSAASVATVVEAVAAQDLLRAYDLLLGVESGTLNRDSAAHVLIRAALRQGRQAPQSIADALVRRNEPVLKDSLLPGVMSVWTGEDPRGAAAWLAANPAQVTEEMAGRLATGLAFDDVRLAADWIELVPQRFQEKWISTVAFRYGQFDIEEAFTWIDRYVGRQGYLDALTALLGGGTHTSPERVASFVETTSLPIGEDLVASAARALAERDPDAAARWALGLRNREHSTRAAQVVASRWMLTDAAAAQRWVLAQPRGEGRDRLLDRLIMSGQLNEAIDFDALVDAYASDAAMQRTVASFIERAVNTPARGREAWVLQAERMLERLTDPELRRQAEREIASPSR